MENGVHDEVAADGTPISRLLEARVQVVLLAVHLSQDIVEGFACNHRERLESASRSLNSSPTPTSEWASTAAAGEAVGVVEVAHCLAGVNHSEHLLAAVAADAKVVTHWVFFFHFLFNLFCQRLNLFNNRSV